MHVTSLGLRTDLMIRRLAGSVVDDRGGHVVVATPSNPTFWWGNYVLMPGPPRPGEAAAWETAFSAGLPGATHRAYAVDGTDGHAGAPAELAALGVEVDVSTVLTSPAGARRDAVLPDGVRLRALADGDWEQLVALQQAGNDEPDSDAELLFRRRRVAEARALAEAGHGAWFGAFDADLLAAALGIVGDGQGLARYQDVDTRPEHRRRGLAGALLGRASRHAADQLGAHTVVIVADPGHHAIELYRSVGFTDAEQQVQLQSAPTG